MFNVPAVIVASIAVLGAIHLLRGFLSASDDIEVLLLFAFLPARYGEGLGLGFPGGAAADVWTFLSYGLLHADLMHLGFNVLWMLAFGTALARRFGAWRFLGFTAVATVGGAVAHLVSHYGETVPMIGASGAISGYMAGAMRFAFQPGGPLSQSRLPGDLAYRLPPSSLAEIVTDRRLLGFLGAFVAANLIVALGAPLLGDSIPAIAWEGHLGGFIAGMMAFALFDPPADPRLAMLIRDLRN